MLLSVVGALALNTAATILLTRASMANYPGGSALALLNERYADYAHGQSALLLLTPVHCADWPTNERLCLHHSGCPHLKPRCAEWRLTLPPYSRTALPRAHGHPSAHCLLRLQPVDLQQD